MVKLLNRVWARAVRMLVWGVEVVMLPAAALWAARAQLIEVAGLVCLVVFAGSFGARWAFLVAGVYLVVRAGVIEARALASSRSKS